MKGGGMKKRDESCKVMIDAMPGEDEGVYGELYVNADQAVRVAEILDAPLTEFP